MAFAALGAAEILDSHPGHHAALALLYRARVVIGDPAADAGWPWPVPRLSYANAAIAEAIIVSGRYLGEDRLLRNGLRMLEWLLATETRDGHLSVVSRQGWSRDEERQPASDQRPAEVAALADACVRAATVTGDDRWLAGVRMCIAWFLGDNDARVPLLDERTGGCSDGLTGAGRSRNQGAESTLAMIAVLQHGRRLVAPTPTPGEQGGLPAGVGNATVPGKRRALVRPAGYVELGHPRERRRDPHLPWREVDDDRGSAIDVNDPSQAVLVMGYEIIQFILLDRGILGRRLEGTRRQVTPVPGAGTVHCLQCAPFRAPVPPDAKARARR